MRLAKARHSTDINSIGEVTPAICVGFLVEGSCPLSFCAIATPSSSSSCCFSPVTEASDWTRQQFKTMATRDFLFIKTDSRGKPKRSDRPRIRSHCMTGKNYRIGLQSTSIPRPRVADGLTSGDQPRTPSQPRRSPDNGSDGEVSWQRFLLQKLAGFVPKSPRSDLSILADDTGTSARMHLSHCTWLCFIEYLKSYKVYIQS